MLIAGPYRAPDQFYPSQCYSSVGTDLLETTEEYLHFRSLFVVVSVVYIEGE